MSESEPYEDHEGVSIISLLGDPNAIRQTVKVSIELEVLLNHHGTTEAVIGVSSSLKEVQARVVPDRSPISSGDIPNQVNSLLKEIRVDSNSVFVANMFETDWVEDDTCSLSINGIELGQITTDGDKLQVWVTTPTFGVIYVERLEGWSPLDNDAPDLSKAKMELARYLLGKSVMAVKTE